MGTGYYFNLPAHGHVNPTLPIVKELINRDEKIIYFSTEEFREKIERTGAKYRAYDFDFAKEGQEVAASGNVVKLAGVLIRATEAIFSTYRNSISSLSKPDYIIHDSMCPWGKCIAQHMGIKGVNTSSTFVFSKDTVNKSDRMTSKVLIMAYETGVVEIYNALKIRRKLFRKYGIAINIKDFLRNLEHLNLVFTSQYFQPGGVNLGEKYQFLGASITDRNDFSEFPFEMLAGQPLIYISLGTVANDNLKFYQNCIKAFSNSNFNVLISTGSKIKMEDFGDIPSNIFIMEYVPQLEVLKRAKLFISHAGMNSVHESLYFGVPLLLFPYSAEQAMVAKRVEELGAGMVILEENINTDLYDKTISIIDNKTFYDKARTIGESFIASGGFKKGADLIMEYIYGNYNIEKQENGDLCNKGGGR